jgi:Protein of unknown function (DUF2865)
MGLRCSYLISMNVNCRSSIAAAFLGLAAWLAPMVATAQVNQVCARLEGQLQALNSNATQRGGPAIKQYEDAIMRQRYELERTIGYARSLGCDRRQSLFELGPSACVNVNQQIRSMQQNIEAMNTQMSQIASGGTSSEGQRRQIIAALQQSGCPGYAPQRSVQDRRRGLFDLLFGQEPEVASEESSPPSYQAPSDYVEENGSAGWTGRYRTLCVRKCDGYYFPINFAVTNQRFETDERVCRAQCPGAETELYFHKNPSEEAQDAVNMEGRPYTAMPNALKYRQSFDPSCSCRPAGQSWAQALSAANDEYRPQKGDIVVSEKRAEELSKPKDARVSNKTLESIAQAQQSIGKLAPQARIVVKGDASQKELILADGTKRIVRVVGPVYLPAN